MTAIVEFIRARLAEDEERVRAASPGPWHPNAEHTEVLAIDDIVVCDGFALSNRQLRATVDHIVDNDPAATLRRCVLVRAMLRHAENAGELEQLTDNDRGVRAYDGDWIDDAMHRDIAAYWSTHPDYRPEWAPVPEFVGPPAPLCQHTNVVAHGLEGGMYRWHCEDCKVSYSFVRNLADCDVVYFLHRVAEQERPQR